MDEYKRHVRRRRYWMREQTVLRSDKPFPTTFIDNRIIRIDGRTITV